MKGTELLKLDRLMEIIKEKDSIIFDSSKGVFKITKLEEPNKYIGKEVQKR